MRETITILSIIGLIGALLFLQMGRKTNEGLSQTLPHGVSNASSGEEHISIPNKAVSNRNSKRKNPVPVVSRAKKASLEDLGIYSKKDSEKSEVKAHSMSGFSLARWAESDRDRLASVTEDQKENIRVIVQCHEVRKAGMQEIQWKECEKVSPRKLSGLVAHH